MKFADKVFEKLKDIPKGKVATYSQIARLIGSPKAPRAVGNVLHKNPTPKIIPCHRIVNVQGKLAQNFSFGGREIQKLYLEEDGVEVIDFCVDLETYLWKM